MGGTGVIDHFLEVFTRYIDSGFGLLSGEVAFIATTLIVIDVTLAALFWSWGADDDIMARLVKKTLFVGVFAYIIGNWNNLARIIFESFAGLGLKASGTGFTTADLLRPGKVAQTGLDAGRPLLDSISSLMGYWSFFENFIQIACMFLAWALVLLAFFILAIQLFVTLIEFKLTTLAGFVLIPFGLFGKSAFMAERVLGNVISSGIKVLVLAVIIGIGSTLFSEFTSGFGGQNPTIDEAMAIEDGDVTLVPKGYHPCAATHGYDLYYLNVMAGPKRTWKFHNAKEQIARGAGPFFYLPKMESHLEARLWNDIFCMAQDEIGIPRGTIKATVLVETILATFEMEEILYELREHSAGLNAGRWDYIFSCIKKFKNNKNFCLANRGAITMEVPFMRSYALQLVKVCHKRGAPAMGGMSALIPIKNDPEANEKALAGIRHDKARDARDGFDGGWVAHPGLVPMAHEEFVKVLGDKPNQWEKQRDEVFTAQDFLTFLPEQPITEVGLRNNINVGIHYLGSWLAGNGCVPIHNLMEDAATAEISRSQVWQWVVSPKGVLDDGRKVTAELVRTMIPEELAKVKATVTAQGEDTATYDQAAGIFEKMSLDPNYPEFLTLPLYEAMD